MRDAADIRRRLRDLYEACFDRGKYVVISSAVRFIPDELERNFVYLELTVPDLIELVAFLRREAETVRAHGGDVDTSDATLFQLGRALQGLTFDEARHAVRRALAAHVGLTPAAVHVLLEEKKLLINRTGMIEYVADGTSIDHIGGLEILKHWLVERRKLFQLRDTISGEIVPKGLLIMGVSGCGKSLSVKSRGVVLRATALSHRHDRDLLRAPRPARGAFRRACRMLEEIAPAVVWFDEIEMGVTSTETAGEQGRIFAFFLTWMQEKARGLFRGGDRQPHRPAAGGDDPQRPLRRSVLRRPAARRRARRDLPDPPATARRRSCRVQLERLKRFTKGWTGAEVEQCVVSAFTAARLQDREVTDEDILNATSSVVPLSKTMKEQVDHIRAWAFDRAVRASPREFGR